MKLNKHELHERIVEWQQRLGTLGVTHFVIDDVVLTDEVPGWVENSNAGVAVSDNYDSCTFYFNHFYVEGASWVQLDQTILHEWVHVAFRDLDNAVRLAQPWFPEATWRTFDENLDHHKETIVDRTARTLYALYAHDPHETGTIPANG